MPSGTMEKMDCGQCWDCEANDECPAKLNEEEAKKKIEEMLKIQKTKYQELMDKVPEEDLIDKEDLNKLFHVIKSKGYLSTETSQECNMIKWAISNSFNKKGQDEDILIKCHEFFAFTINLANMFLVHYRTKDDY